MARPPATDSAPAPAVDAARNSALRAKSQSPPAYLTNMPAPADHGRPWRAARPTRRDPRADEGDEVEAPRHRDRGRGCERRVRVDGPQPYGPIVHDECV